MFYIDDLACKQYKLLFEGRSFLSYLMFMCNKKCAYKLKGCAQTVSLELVVWVVLGKACESEAGEEIFNRGVTNFDVLATDVIFISLCSLREHSMRAVFRICMQNAQWLMA